MMLLSTLPRNICCTSGKSAIYLLNIAKKVKKEERDPIPFFIGSDPIKWLLFPELRAAEEADTY